jgi:hypothetical protein
MALHETPSSMLKESLDETLEAAKFCVDYRKTDKKWGEFNTAGCLGYPGAILLFSLIDTIGSYFRRNMTFTILIDGRQEKINGEGWEHFKILNSKYFDQKLSTRFIKNLYILFRSCLTHNSILGSGTLMIPDNSIIEGSITGLSFGTTKDEKGEIVYVVSIKELWDLCSKAVNLFKNDIDIVVPKSKVGKDFKKIKLL